MAIHRPIRFPSADFDRKPLPYRTVNGLTALRIHGGNRAAVQFRVASSHRFSHPDAPGGLLYLAFDLETCLWECFGDAILAPVSVISRSVWMNRRVSCLTSATSFRICDLTDLKTRSSLKVDLSTLNHTDLVVPNAWGLAIQNHPDYVDGMYYLSRFTGKQCLLLFERNRLSTSLETELLGDLSDLECADRFLDENKIAIV